METNKGTFKIHDVSDGRVLVARAVSLTLRSASALLSWTTISRGAQPPPLIRTPQYLGGSWGILFSHPNDYTPVCTTELGEAALQQHEFDKRGVKLIGLSCNTAADHDGWVKDIEALRGPGSAPQFPIIADPKRDVAALLGMLDEDEKDAPGIPATVRKVFVIGPDRKTKLILVYPTSVGRNFAEVRAPRVGDGARQGMRGTRAGSGGRGRAGGGAHRSRGRQRPAAPVAHPQLASLPHRFRFCASSTRCSSPPSSRSRRPSTGCPATT